MGRIMDTMSDMDENRTLQHVCGELERIIDRLAASEEMLAAAHVQAGLDELRLRLIRIGQSNHC